MGFTKENHRNFISNTCNYNNSVFDFRQRGTKYVVWRGKLNK